MWPTPSASLPNDGEEPETFLARREMLAERHGNNGMGMPLAIAAKLWPTPTTADSDRMTDAYGNGSPTLDGMARFWASPVARDWKAPGPGNRYGRQGTPPLSQQVNLWPTPRANDAEKRGEIAADCRNGLPAASRSFPQGRPTCAHGGPCRRVLNPRFVAWLMGWRWLIGLIGCDCSATASSPMSLRRRTASSGADS